MMIVPADWIKALHLIWFASSSTIPILFSRAWLMPEARRACTTGCLLQIVPFPSSQDSIPTPFQVVCHSGSNKGDLHFLNTCWKHNGQKPRALNLDLMLRDAREWHKLDDGRRFLSNNSKLSLICSHLAKPLCNKLAEHRVKLVNPGHLQIFH